MNLYKEFVKTKEVEKPLFVFIKYLICTVN